MHKPVSRPTMNTRPVYRGLGEALTLQRMRKVLMSLIFVVACTGEHKAYVECAGQPGGFGCTVSHTEGSRPIKACWAVSVECTNGVNTKAKACQVVQPMGKASKLVPEADFPNADQCDAVSGVSVVDIKLAVVD